MSSIKLTPMMKQYQEAKNSTPSDSVLLFRLGDFYEIFFDDAEIAAPILGITQTKRAGVPMCGFPHHSLQNYLPKLLNGGYKVAIAEQIEDPKQAVGIVKRAVTRIITPGTIIEDSALAPKNNNFLTAFFENKKKIGLASLDLSTGDFRVTELPTYDKLEAELHRLQTKECIITEALAKKWADNPDDKLNLPNILWTSLDSWIFSYDTAEESLKRHFSVASLDGFGCRNIKSAICAAGAILHYATENLKQDAGHIKKIKTYTNENYMELDYISQRNLELVSPMAGGLKNGTLISILDEASTPMGSRLLKEWILRPLYSKEAIIDRLDAVANLKNDPMTLAELTELIGFIRDLERIIARLNIGSANARDMIALSDSLKTIPGIKTLLSFFNIKLLDELNGQLSELTELTNEIDCAIADEPPVTLNDGGIIRKGYNEILDELRSASTEGKSWLATLQAKEQERTGIKNLKMRYNKVFGYYIEVSKGQLGNVPEDYIRKQTLVNAERFITPELKEIENKILGAEDKSKALEFNLFQKIRIKSIDWTDKIQETALALAAIDALCSLAECAKKYNYTRPQINDEGILEIEEGRHPVLDAQMITTGQRFVPNNVLLDDNENRMMIITGPNMAGKSTYIRQTAMLTLMAQMGSFIPAKCANICLVDRIFTRVGAADDISRGQSTFMVEMVEAANILNHATNKSLVILDEIGRGTSTFDGLSLAWSIAEYLHNTKGSQAKTQFATHYHELTELAMTCRGVQNYNVAVKEYGDQIIFLRQIVKGGTDKSYGIHVAKLAGLPNSVINRAKEILTNLENNAMTDSQPALAEKHISEANEDAEDYEKIEIKFQPSLF